MSSNLRIEKICKYCGDLFIAKTTVTKYCSHDCNRKAYKRRQKLERLENSDIETLISKLLPLLELQQKQFLSIKETSKLLGVSYLVIHQQIKNKGIRSIQLNNRVIIRRNDIDQLFE